ncbi:virulence factor Mce-like protein [Mycobacterium sp. MAA66]|uniref:MCE family protein n=1 Tax=Mycobacterium sp. MAA66 TaxID=3156297 RepID=UPI003518D78A
MNALLSPLELVARLVVDTVRALSRSRLITSCAALILAATIAGGYVVFGALQINPTRTAKTIKIELPTSGGLLPGQDVTYRGIPVGRVSSVRPSVDGVEADVNIRADVQIPQNSEVRVSGLSAAGEQYLDFRPADSHGPFLVDGSTISKDQTAVPVPIEKFLADTDGLLGQLDPTKLGAIFDELRVGPQGPQKLSAIFDGGSLMVSTLDSVLPQTVSVLRESRIALTTVAQTAPGANRTSQNLRDILAGAARMDRGFRTLLDRGSSQLSAVDDLLADNSDTMVQLLGSLTTVAQLSYVRVPALKALFPTDRGSAIEALGTAFRDGGLWVFTNPYPRYGCDYQLPAKPPTVPDFPEPYLYTYCTNPDPAVLIRGARNAPRPPGDDTAGPPPNVDPLKTTDPTPAGPWTIPTTYGGPPMPFALPPK